jgi:transcription elongation factor Elf1
MTAESHRLRCPGCGATYRYSLDKIDESNSVECQNCAMRFSTQIGSDGLIATPVEDTDAIKPSIHFLASTTEGVRVKCPNCGSKYVYTDEHKLDSQTVSCQNCGSAIDYVGEAILLVKEPAPAGTQTEDWGLCAIILIIFLFVPLIIAIPLIICIVAWKGTQSYREPKDLDTKVVKRDSEGPSPW